MERYIYGTGKEAARPDVDAFLDEIVLVSKKHGFALAHEDRHGGFLVEAYNNEAVEWLQEAAVNDKK